MKRAEQTPLEMVAPSRPRGRLPRASRGRRFGIWAIAFLFPILAHCGVARASVALLMEEPYGDLGQFDPTGHAAVYLNHVCAASPIEL